MEQRIFNILLVEDDANIRDYVKTLVNEANIGFYVIAEADNGLSGAEIAKKIIPDVIITDICMPVMNGFEMLDALSEYNFESIILSGYDDFEYFKMSLKNNVKDYLLKPVNKSDLYDTLSYIYDKLSTKKTSVTNEALSYLRSNYIQTLFDNNAKNDNPDILLSLIPSLRYQYIAVVYISSSDTSVLQNLIITHLSNCIIIEFEEDGLFVLHNSQHPLSVNEIYSEYTAFSNSNTYEYIGISVPKKSPENLITAIFSAHRCVDYQKLTGDINCYYDELLPAENINSDSLYEYFNKLYQDIENNEMEKCRDNLNKLFILAFFLDDAPTIKTLITKFLFYLEHKYSEIFGIMSTPFDIPVKAYNSLFNLKINVERIIAEVIKNKSSGIQNYNKIVRDAIALIHEKYASITVEGAAEQLFISPSYLMYLFKKDTNETFNNYIINYRMNVACRLLESGKRIGDVSEAVGYKSVKFFSTLFKKKIGLSPSEYAKQHNK